MPKLDDILKDKEEEEEVPDVEIKIPANKVKYMVGQGGEKIKWIQRKSKARVQVSPRLGAADCLAMVCSDGQGKGVAGGSTGAT